MKKILMIVIVAVTMFGAAAGASWKWRRMKMAAAAAISADEHADEDSPNDASESPESATPPASHGGNPQVPATNRVGKSAVAHETPAHVGVQPSYTPSVNEAVQLASSLRDRAALVRERENQLNARQRQLELVIEDIRSERAAIDELRSQADELLKAGEERMAEVERQRTELEIKQQKIDGRVTEMVGQEKDNIKKMGSVYDNMAPENAAKIIQQMADGGTMDTAVKLLAVMKERQAAKVLSEMPDPSLAAQLSERLKDLKRPTAAVKK
jgi:flagellar motility protein MotE (MotC chaperone)